MKLAGTGHRPNKLGYEYNMKGPYSNFIRSEFKDIIEAYKPTDIGSGMALGTDTILAVMALNMGVPLTCICAFNGMEMKWPHESRLLYHKILSKAKRVVFVSDPPYFAYKMQKRNEWMVDWLDQHEDRLVSVHDGSAGGTANCIAYAEKKHKIIIPINLQTIYETNS